MLQGMIRIATGIAIAVSLSGCLINRVQTVQTQACEFEKNFEVSVDDGMSVTFLNPVLLYDDVAFFAGIAPDLKRLKGNRYVASYTLKKIGDSDRPDIPVHFEFSTQGDDLLLVKASVQSPLLASFHPARLPQLTESACNTNIPLWRTRIEVPIPEFDRSIIPTRKQVIELAGNPTRLGSKGNELEYQFVLEGADNNELTGSINLAYDDNGQNLLQTRTRFYHYVTGTDFESGMAWGSVSL